MRRPLTGWHGSARRALPCSEVVTGARAGIARAPVTTSEQGDARRADPYHPVSGLRIHSDLPFYIPYQALPVDVRASVTLLTGPAPTRILRALRQLHPEGRDSRSRPHEAHAQAAAAAARVVPAAVRGAEET